MIHIEYKKPCDSTDLSELSREELISMINQMKENENQMKKEMCLLKTELNEYKKESKKSKSKKRQKSSGSEALDRQTVNKKSFSDRICDDLCEEILQYLSLEDKLKLEGVSKQFQRTVLKKHYELILENVKQSPNRFWMFREVKPGIVYIENILFDSKSLEVLLKKCPNITSIELRDFNLNYDYNEVFRLITKYCNNLREIEFSTNKISDENIEEFQQKFWPKIKFIYRLKDANNYNLFPNIEKLKFFQYIDLQEVIPRLKLNKLKNFEVSIPKGEEDMVKTCVNSFPTLRRFRLIIIRSEIEIYNSFEFISNLKHLIDFGFFGRVDNNKLFCDSLKRMANKCQKLKRIECSLKMTSENSDIRQILTTIKAFPALKRLDLNLYGKYDLYLFQNIVMLSGRGGDPVSRLRVPLATAPTAPIESRYLLKPGVCCLSSTGG